jgi:hypothetical protein
MHAKDCVVLLCFTELGATYPLDEREDVTIRNEWPVIACLLFRLTNGGRVFRSKDSCLSIHHGTQKRTVLSIENWIVDGGRIVRDYLYATSGSSDQNGIKTNASAFR